MRRIRLSSSSAFIAVSLLALLISACLFGGAAFADNWTEVASGGISGGYAPVQDSVTSMAQYGSVLYAGTDNPADGCQVWAFTGGSWLKVRDGGFGDKNNIVAKNMAVFNNKLYVGTGKYSTGAEVWSFDGSTWSQANSDGFGNQKNIEISSMTVFNNALYAGTKNNQNGAEVWKYNGTSWSRVGQSGFGDTSNVSIGALFGYGSDLFAGTFNTSAGAEVWRYNGSTWTQSVGQSAPGTIGTGPGFGGGGENPSVSTMAVYNGKLYAGLDPAWDTQVWVGPIPGLASQPWARMVWSFDGTSWKSVPGAVAGGGTFGGPTFGLGSVVDESITSMGVYGSTLVVGTKNEVDGCELYANNGTNWTLLNEPGFGEVQNKNADSLAVSGTNLYVGTRNLKSGAETWAYNGSAWTRLSRFGFAGNNNYSAGPMLVAGGNLYTAPASKGGAELWQYNGSGWSQKGSEGFGDTMNQQVSSMVLFNSNIYLGTRNTTDGGEVYRYDGAGFTQINKSGFISTDYWYNDNVQSMAVHSSSLYAGVYNEEKWDSRTPGCRIYKYSGSGTSWSSDISSPGFGDKYNTGAPSMISFNNVLYVGTYNPLTGCEIWQKSGSTWKQINTDGFGNASTHSASAMVVMGGKLYVGTSGAVFSVWRFDGGTTWTKVAADNLGETGNTGIASLAVLGNVLYAGTNTGQGTGKVWRYDGSAWEKAAQPGFGATGNTDICSLAAFDSKIFAGTANSTNGCEVWSSLGLPGSIQSISPVKGSQGQTLDVTINGNGTRFDATSVASFSGSGLTVNKTTFKNTTQVVANITISDAAAPGKRDVNVTTGDDTPKALQQAFTVLNPRITGVSPDTLAQGATTDLTITGADTGFTSSSEAVVIGSGVTVLDTDYVSPTQLKASVKVSDSASIGPRGINVDTPGITTDKLDPAFSIEIPPPRLEKVSPTVAYVGEEVTLEGKWFDSGAGSSKVTFNGKPATYIPVWTDDMIVAAVPYGATSGPVVVKTEAGSSGGKSIKVVNTKPGSDVKVAAGNGVNVLFSLVTGAGNTRASGDQDPVVSGFTVIPGSTRDVTSTADYSGKILVTFYYTADLQRYQQEGMVVMHEEGGKWVDVTVDRNIDEKSITGQVDSLSRFVLAIPGDVTVPAGATWYLAEGSTAYGFDTYISIQNPNPRAVTASVTYMTDTGPVPRADIPLPAMSQTTLFPRNDIGERDFSTRVQCLEAETIAVDRTMTWTGQGAASPEAHSSIGVAGPNNLWYLPEGSSDWGFETWLLIQNPNDAEAVCEVTYMIEDEGPKTVTHNVAPNSRDTFSMETDIGKKDASIMVECPIPVIAERAMYRNNRREGHDSVGATQASNNYFLAEGSTAWGFTTFVLVQNPNDEKVDMSMTLMTDGGPVQGPAKTMDPNSRETFRINDMMPNKDFSTQVTGSLPIIAERAMYWDNGTGEACHDSIGETGSHATFYLPDGQSNVGYETWTLVQNPNDEPVEVEITYLTPTGTGNISFTEEISANSRETFSMGTEIMNVRAAVMVTCKTPGKRIMVERAMYWNNKGGGTSTIGGYTD